MPGTAFQVGLSGPTALHEWVFAPAPGRFAPHAPVYWLRMPIGMVKGSSAARPADTSLIRRGVGEPV